MSAETTIDNRTAEIIRSALGAAQAGRIKEACDVAERGLAGGGDPAPLHAVPRDVLQARICPAGCGVKAFYLTDEGVFIDAALDTQNDIVARSVLLHELVHYAQAVAHRFEALSRCAAWHAREDEAYQIQNEYLRQQGSAIRQFMPGGIHRCA